MRGYLMAAGLGLLAMAGGAFAQDLIPDRRPVISMDVDVPGGDLRSVIDTTLEACERACLADQQCQAYTFNSLNGRCFLKSVAGSMVDFGGAISGVLIPAATPEDRAAQRRSAAPFLTEADIAQAVDQARGLQHLHTVNGRSADEFRRAAARTGGEQSANLAGAAVVASDLAGDWTLYSVRLMAADAGFDSRAFSAAVNAFLRADAPDRQRDALVALAAAAERMGRGDDTVRALRLAQAIAPDDRTATLLSDAAGKYGFRVEGVDVQSDSARPRICATFTGDLQSGTDFAPYVALPDPALSVEAIGPRQLCVEGVAHGARYAMTFRQGLPAADGQVLATEVRQSAYVRDRTPAARFAGRGYVLPKTGAASIPVQTVNTDTLDLSLYHIADRNLLRSMQDGLFATPIEAWRESDLDGNIGNSVWSGTATVANDVNRDVTTRLPLDQAIWGLPAGVYALKAAIPDTDPYDQPPAWQWFVVSDLGITTYSGQGLEVVVRSLTLAEAKAGAEVTLLSRANEVLGTATTDAEGRAGFAAGLTRGTGGAAPALVTVRDGDADLAFLSLTDPEFDLSDRGVEGREPAPAVDVFLTTDRGAYRAGEVVNVTALARDGSARAVADLPLTAILMRPDGVEHSRQLVPDQGAGGHVFALPISGSAPRGVWRLEMRADTGAAPLAATTFLVEDFLPERIDFDLTLADTLLLNSVPDLGIDARYLFGAPGADLTIEGEVLLRAASTLPGYEGFSFGRHDAPFDAMMEPLPTARTDAAGKAVLPLTLPFVETATRPLEARITVRVAEGSGRPVEREVLRPVAPGVPLIGIRPLFDGVAAQGAEARFAAVSLDASGRPAPANARWELTRIETEYQWYQQYGNWNWEPFTTRERIAEGEITIDGPAEVAAPVEWGEYELRVASDGAESSVTFYAGWYAPADAASTPDMLELSLDRRSYAPGDEAILRMVPRFDGTALVTVLTDRVVSVQSVKVTAGENLVPLTVSADWGTGAYVTASVLRPMDVAAGRGPSRALGVAHAAIDPGARRLPVVIETVPQADPRGPLDIAVKVDAAPGEMAQVTLAAVDLGILNLTGFDAPDPSGHYFGQRKLGVGIRDIYGRLIDGLNGAEGQVRSGGDAGAQARLQAPPPTEELVAFFSGPLVVGPDGYARTSFDLPSFNGSVKVMAVAWTKSGVGQAESEVLVRDPVVVTASLPRFMAPGDESRVLLEVVHASGPAGPMVLNALGREIPFDLAEGGTARFEVPLTAGDPGLQTIEVGLTTPDDKRLIKTLTLPVQVNDPAVSRVTRFDLAAGGTFTFDDNAYAGLTDATATLAIGPIARMNAPGLLASLDRYPYGCTEQITSKALPLIYFDQVAQAMRLDGAEDIRTRVEQSVAEVLTNQGAEGGFGLWSPGSGDLWLDAYVTDFLSRARAQGIAVPDMAFTRALDNLRNQVNAAPDFDAQTNDGGTGIAYGLMVLAREGAATVGDLRYYADVKAGDFATPLAQAQLGAALASYGDQTRADAMFALAANGLRPEGDRQIWRSDYGTALRDTAAVLTLAVEAGSTAVDTDALAGRVAAASGRLSTQEAAWALLATNALVDAPRVDGLIIDGAAPDGPLVRMRQQGEPASVVRTDVPTTLTLTAYGVPTELEPAGGNGYSITRSYYSMEGAPVDITSVPMGTRLVAVLEVTPFNSGQARLMVSDPLPAGFEIDNPNLISGQTSALEWLNTETDVTHSEFRQDRFLTALDRHNADPFRLAYIVRAVSPGSFHHPAAMVEDMYRPDFRARTGAGRVVVTP